MQRQHAKLNLTPAEMQCTPVKIYDLNNIVLFSSIALTMARSEVNKTGNDVALTSVTDSRGFLGDLTHQTCPIPKYAYRGEEQFLQDFQHALNTAQSRSEWLLLTKVTKEIFHAVFLESEEPPFSSVSSYDDQLEILLLRMVVSRTHEAAAHEFHRLLGNATTRYGVQLRVYGGYHSAADRGKIPDVAWRPIRLPRGRSLDWPSVVLEVSFSETRQKLMSDVRHWLGASDGDVKVVLTVSIERHTPKIAIEQWVKKNGRGGREQRIEIRKSGVDIKVSENALQISFERMFLCPPSTDGEAVILVHAPELKSFAQAIWEQQGFIDVERI